MTGISSAPSVFRTGGIGDLPPEVLSEVASHLDFIDILSLQQTSKKLRSSAEAHIVWLALAKKYSVRHFHLYRPETGPFDDLNTDQLCAWIRKRLVVDQIWRARHARLHFRTIHTNTMEPRTRATFLKLVPGARWLLMGCSNGSVCCYDLDSEDLKRALLIPPSSTVERTFESVTDLQLHVDEDALRLEFKLVCVLSIGNGRSEKLHVWQVKLEGDGNSLAAEQLDSIPFDDLPVVSVTLGRHLMARAVTLPSYTSWVEITRWDQCSGTRVPPVRFDVSKGPKHVDEIHLIGDDKLLCIAQDGVVLLYTLPEPNHTDGYVSLGFGHFPSREPIWSHSLPGGTYKCSSPVYYDGTTYRLAINVGDLIWGLSFPATKDSDPSVVKLMNTPQGWDTCILGVCKAYAYRNESGTRERIEYSWSDGGGTPTIRHSGVKRKDAQTRFRYSAFDEEVGRFVYLTGRDIIVEDYFH